MTLSELKEKKSNACLYSNPHTLSNYEQKLMNTSDFYCYWCILSAKESTISHCKSCPNFGNFESITKENTEKYLNS